MVLSFLLFLSWGSFAEVIQKESLTLSGVFTQGGVVRGTLPPESEVSFGGRKLTLTPNGHFVFGFGRDEVSEAVLSWRIPGGLTKQLQLSITPRDYPTQRVDGVPQNTVTPSEDKLARIRSETALVKNARKQHSMQEYFEQAFIQPLIGPKTGVYGSRRIYNGVPKRPHYGVDYAAAVGTLVKAPADATVSLVHDDMYYSGGTLIMDHGYGLSSTFIHLSEVLVKEGQAVKQGEYVAKVGAGGRSTGPHLDWRLNWFEVRLDPELILQLEKTKK